MEAKALLLIVLLAVALVDLVVVMPRLVRQVREGRNRMRDERTIQIVAPRMLERLAAISAPISAADAEPVLGETVDPVAASQDLEAVEAPVDAAADIRVEPRRRLQRDVATTLFAFVCIGLVLGIAAPELGAFGPFSSPRAAVVEPTAVDDGTSDSRARPPLAVSTLVPAPLPSRIAVALPSPIPSLPLTAIRRPIASFTCSLRHGLRVKFHNRSEAWGAPASYHWDFGGDGSSSAVNPTHTFSAARGYTVTLIVSNSAGRSDVFAVHIHTDRRTGC